jgi:Peptidase family C25, C terminal ig-like domain./Peptidase family C25./Propeptide_C25.
MKPWEISWFHFFSKSIINFLLMKKTLLFLLVILAFASGNAQNWHSIKSDSPVGPKTSLVSNSEKQIVVDFQLAGFNMMPVSTQEGRQMIVEVPDMVSMLEAGAPDLPMFAIPVIIGDVAEMNVSISNAKYTDFHDVAIAPSKGNFSRQINPDDVPYTYGSMYQKDAFYPTAQAYLEDPYILRDFRGQNIMVVPFAYNAITKTLRVYHSLTIEMTKVSNNGENQKNTRKSNFIKVDPEMEHAYSQRFINFNAATSKYTFIEDEGSMIVICPEQYMESMQPYVAWKNQSGRPTTMVSLADAGGNNDTQIKNYIQNIYDDPNQNLTFILLVGDYSDITPHSMSGGRSDNWFGQLEGTDYYVEAFTGRFSVSNVTDVETHVNKVLYYERDMPAGLSWVNVGIGVGANEGAGNGHNGGEADYVHMDYIRDTLMHYTYANVTQQYSGVGGGTSAAAISADFNNGVSIGNYCNHGSQTSWAVGNFSNSHVNALTNDYMWPYIWSVACNNGEFDGTCFGEAWLRATNSTTGAPTGAIGGMFSWISQPWTPPMTGQDEMVNIITGWKSSDQYNHTFGGASLNGNMYILDMHPTDNGSTHNTWILFGDPSLMIRTDNPVSMNVQHTNALLVGMSELQIQAEAEFGIATLSFNGEVIASTKIENGNGTLTFEPLANVGSAELCVIGYNKVTYIGAIDVIPADGSYVTLVDYTPQELPYAQTSSISLNLKNVGNDPTTGNCNLTLTTDNTQVTIVDGEATYGVIGADETVSIEDAFSITLPADVENGQSISFTVTITCGSDTWTNNLTITVQKPIVEYTNFIWPGSFVPGETVTVYANFKNSGAYKAENAVCLASTASTDVTIEEPSFTLGTIDADGVATAIYQISIDANHPSTEPIIVNFAMTADNGISAEGDATLKNACNVVFALADSYGDGWNGASLTIDFSDGTPSQTLTMTGGSSETYVLEIGSGTHVTVKFNPGSYDSECSFTISYEDGDQIYASSGTPSPGVVFEFDCACGGSAVVFNPVQNLVATVDMTSVMLTWEAPAAREVSSYIVRRDGVEIAEQTETEYTDTNLVNGTYNYCIIAVYADGESVPVCATATVTEDGVDESSYSFSVYPNPANGTLNISVSGTANDFEYSIINAQGQVLVEKSLGSFTGVEQINVNNCAKGVYFLRMTTGSQVEIQKIFVK